MSLEAWSTAASIGTFVVIAATAGAALVQLRHLRSSNQIAAITKLQDTLESERMTLARRFVNEQVPKLLADPAGRSKLGAAVLSSELEAVRHVGNFFNLVGTFVRLGIVDRDIAVGLWDGIALNTWRQLEAVVMIRREVYSPGAWCDFEYLAVLSQESIARTGGDYYPRGMRRMVLDKRSSDAVAAFVRERAAQRNSDDINEIQEKQEPGR